MFDRGYGLTTLCLFRATVTHLHLDPHSLRQSELVNTLFQTLASKAPPKPIHRPTIDFTPTFAALRNVDCDSSLTNITSIQRKPTFLLGITAFLRPSDLHRIDFPSASILPTDSDSVLEFNVVAPKEKRQGQHILKPFRVYAHTDVALCPVHTFRALRDRILALSPPATTSTLFVNCKDTSTSVTTTTISSWLRRFIQLSTSERRVNVRSLGSSLALRRGVPLDDIITLGNWSSSDVFHNHYRREQMSLVDFTNVVLPSTGAPSTADDDDEFYDALDSFASTL